MKNKLVAFVGIIFGGLFLSLEIYMLKIVQFIDKSTGSWFENVWEYAKIPPCNIALIITVAVVCFSFYVFITSKDSSK